MVSKDESKVKHDETTAKADKPEADQQHTPDLTSLLETLHGDLTSIDSETAIAAIDEWQNALKGTKDEDLKAISNGLKELKKLLHGKKTEAAELGEVLTQLGEQTDKAAEEADRGTKGQLREVGKALSKVGKSLAKATDEAAGKHDQDKKQASHEQSDEESLDLKSLVETLEGDLTAIEPEAAIALIDEWEAAIKETKDDSLKAIDHSLKELKKQLKLKKADPAKLAEVLIELGEQTSQMADHAERGTKGQLREVGKALSKAGKSLDTEA
jgi:mRNA-degrading endonuclease YafQ of YafQ-DinJ toxin-antitoxin module